jgi:serine protease Do
MSPRALGVIAALSVAACSGTTPHQLSNDAARAADGTAAGINISVSPHADTPTPSSVADLVEQLSPKVVNISSVQRASAQRPRGGHPFDFFFPEGGPRERQTAGTGFVIDSAGYIITNAHVVADVDEVEVRLHDDRTFKASVVGRDPKMDLALLRVEGAAGLPAVTLGSSDKLRVGEEVIAVGNPFGLGHTVTMGIVSAKARAIGAGPYDDFIQTDASINPGNSGGPLFNRRGEVIGINTAIRAGADGIGFAIPVDALKDIVAQLKDKGFVERGKLGLAFQPVTAEIAQAVGLDRPRGAMVTEILAGSAAARAGFVAGDIIVAVDGAEIHRAEELPRNVARHAPGSTISIDFLRKGNKQSIKATLDKLEDYTQPPARSPGKSPTSPGDERLGLELDDHPDGGARVTGMTRPVDGLLPGDRIVELNGRAITNSDALAKGIAALETGATALLKIERRGTPRYVGVPIR